MQLRITDLETDTIFEYGGKEYKAINNGGWVLGMAKKSGDICIHEQDAPENTPVITCAMKMGGKFQTKIKIWITKTMLVEVNPD